MCPATYPPPPPLGRAAYANVRARHQGFAPIPPFPQSLLSGDARLRVLFESQLVTSSKPGPTGREDAQTRICREEWRE